MTPQMTYNEYMWCRSEIYTLERLLGRLAEDRVVLRIGYEERLQRARQNWKELSRRHGPKRWESPSPANPSILLWHRRQLRRRVHSLHQRRRQAGHRGSDRRTETHRANPQEHHGPAHHHRSNPRLLRLRDGVAHSRRRSTRFQLPRTGRPTHPDTSHLGQRGQRRGAIKRSHGHPPTSGEQDGTPARPHAEERRPIGNPVPRQQGRVQHQRRHRNASQNGSTRPT